MRGSFPFSSCSNYAKLLAKLTKAGLIWMMYGVETNYFFLLNLLVQSLSKTKYHTALAKGSTIASVNAIINDTSAINIKTVIAIAKCPIV
mgnify:CR=1 FL=1